jgi:hypothetical protein
MANNSGAIAKILPLTFVNIASHVKVGISDVTGRVPAWPCDAVI